MVDSMLSGSRITGRMLDFLWEGTQRINHLGCGPMLQTEEDGTKVAFVQGMATMQQVSYTPDYQGCKMQGQLIASIRDELWKRALDGGGFAVRAAGGYRADATAWAIIALAAMGTRADLLGPARRRLAAGQFSDGRVSVLPEHPKAFWPTPLAILAWQGSPVYREAQERAVQFLLKTTGRHWRRRPDSVFGHDTAIPGWPWTAQTHSWVEPTSLSLLALQAAGHADHRRAQEAVHMLMDRQLPRGGWNYGNTFVFGQELRPSPESTGIALSALAGCVPRENVKLSLEFLNSRVKHLRTPLALGWSLLGLGAWGGRPAEHQAWVMESLKQQEKYGTYDTVPLCLLLTALAAGGKLTRVGAQ